MQKFVKKLLVGILAGTMLLGSVATSYAATSPSTSTEPVKQTETVSTASGVKATVATKADGTATVKAVKTTKKTVTVGKTVKVDGVSYTVTTIGAKAFANAKNLKTVKINNANVKVSKNALKGVKAKSLTVKLPAKATKAQKNALKKAFKAAAKNAGIKVVFK